ncbi:PAS domain S-box protein, partial [Acinetobacter baumannii]
MLLGEDLDQPESRALDDAIAAGRSATVVLRHYRADGSLFFDEVSVAPVLDEMGEPQHYVYILNDVTERERARLAIA